MAATTGRSLMELELPVTVVFGSARVPIREVLQLGSGCVLELDRAVQDPVELRVNDITVGLGELVAVDGHYGVRLTEVFAVESIGSSISPLRPQNRESEDPNA